MIALDAAYPPSAQQWVADLDAAGADGAFYYALGPIALYTPAHLAAARAAGKRLAAIIVPGSAPTAIWPMLAVVDALGGAGEPVVIDLETGSLPPALWVADAVQAAREAGHPPRRYGDEGVLAGYPPGDGDWVSHGPGLSVRAGWSPADGVPAVPAGRLGWQFAVEATINGSSYDVSTCDPSLFGGDMDPALAAELKAFLDGFPVQAGQLAQTWNFLYYGADGGVQGAPFVAAMLNHIAGDDDQLVKLATSQGAALSAVTDTLGHLKTEVEAGGSVDAAAAIARIEKALEGA